MPACSSCSSMSSKVASIMAVMAWRSANRPYTHISAYPAADASESTPATTALDPSLFLLMPQRLVHSLSLIVSVSLPGQDVEFFRMLLTQLSVTNKATGAQEAGQPAQKTQPCASASQDCARQNALPWCANALPMATYTLTVHASR